MSELLQIFVFRDGKYLGFECFPQQRVLVGSAKSADLLLEEAGGVLPIHALLTTAEGKMSLTAAGGSVLINDVPTVSAELSPFDEVRLGGYLLKAKLAAPEGEVQAAGSPRPTVASPLPAAATPAEPRRRTEPLHALQQARGLPSSPVLPAAPEVGADGHRSTAARPEVAVQPREPDPRAAQPSSVRLREDATAPSTRLAGERPAPLSPAELPPRPAEVPGSPPGPRPPGARRAVEVLFSWQGTLLAADHHTGRRTLTLGGTPGCDYPVDPAGLGVACLPFLALDGGGGVVLTWTAEVTGEVELACGERTSLEALAKSGQAQAVALPAPAHRFPLPAGAAARLSYGPVGFQVRTVAAAGRPPRSWLGKLGPLELGVFGAVALCWTAVLLLFSTIEIEERLAVPVVTQRFAQLLAVQEQKKEKKPEPVVKEEPTEPKPKRKPEPQAPKSNLTSKQVPQQKMDRFVKEGGALRALARRGIGGRTSLPELLSNLTTSSKAAPGAPELALGGDMPQGTIGLGKPGAGASTKGGRQLFGAGSKLGALEGRGGSGRKVRAMVTKASRQGIGTSGGVLDREAISRVVNGHFSEVQNCYERSLLHEPGLKGQLVVEWTIGLRGEVTRVGTRLSTVRSQELSSCILGRIKKWRFPAPKGGVVIVSYPFIFSSVGF